MLCTVVLDVVCCVTVLVRNQSNDIRGNILLLVLATLSAISFLFPLSPLPPSLQRAFPADSSSSPTPSPDQPTCPATPSLCRVRSRLLSLSESGEFEFIDEGHPPLSADTISTTSSEIGMSDDREDRLGSSVDLLYDPLQVCVCVCVFVCVHVCVYLQQ